MGWKEKGYFSSQKRPPNGVMPLPDGLPPTAHSRVALGLAAVGLAALGALGGLWLAPDSPAQLRADLQALRAQLAAARQEVQTLHEQGEGEAGGAAGHLGQADRERQERHGHLYAQSLQRAGAQGAGELMEWFVRRWNQLLDRPQPDDRVGRRAAALSLLIGGMARNINPGDYVAWQEEFFAAGWLGELHFDLDGDGLPASRHAPNTHDGFANVSVCHVAMALNQAMTDARIFIMPELRCDRVDARMSVFLQGRTLDDALTEFIRTVRDQGFVAVDREDRGKRLVLLGKRLASRPAP